VCSTESLVLRLIALREHDAFVERLRRGRALAKANRHIAEYGRYFGPRDKASLRRYLWLACLDPPRTDLDRIVAPNEVHPPEDQQP